MVKLWNKIIDGVTNSLTKLARKGQLWWYAATFLAIMFIGACLAILAFLAISLWLISSFLVDSTHYFGYTEGLIVKVFISLILFGCLRLFNGKQ